MREFGNSVAQFAAIVMIMITLAISTAVISQWFSPEDGGRAIDATGQVASIKS